MSQIPPLLAENFDNVWICVIGMPVMLIVLAGVSWRSAAVGSKAGLAMAGGTAGVGAILFVAAAMAHATGWVLLISALPTVIGLSAIFTWNGKPKL